jgi:tRNA A37 threonylcarbamoyladenosine dehydratase
MKSVNPLFQRLGLLVGAEALDTLWRTKVIVFGLGGVGSWTAEALVRSGVGSVAIVDSDAVCVTNCNRQVQATFKTIGKPKAAILKERLLEINPGCQVTAFQNVFSLETARFFDIPSVDYVIDAIDSLSYKLDLIETASNAGVKLYSSMGTAQKLDPTRLKTADIWDTDVCPLARLVRQGLRKRGFAGHFTAVYSTERLPLHTEVGSSCGSGKCLCPARTFCAGADGGAPDSASANAPAPASALANTGANADVNAPEPASIDGNADRDAPANSPEWCATKKVINGSAVTVTATAGMILAGLVVQDVYGK